MPAFGYILLLNENVHQYLTIKYDGWLLNYLPSTWRIWLLFYGSFFLAIASILYSLFCPGEIKRYASAFEMADAGSEHHVRMGLFKGVRDAVQSLYKSLSKFERSMLSMPEPDYSPTQLQIRDEMRETMSKLLVHQWIVQNVKRPWLRIVIFVLFSAGLALIAIPAILTFIQVTGLLVKRVLL